jgi:hypothetical protein
MRRSMQEFAYRQTIGALKAEASRTWHHPAVQGWLFFLLFESGGGEEAGGEAGAENGVEAGAEEGAEGGAEAGAGTAAREIPGHPFKGPNAARDAFKHLEKYHGVNPVVASERLHAIKDANGLGPAD